MVVKIVLLLLGASFWLMLKMQQAKRVKGYSLNKFMDRNFLPFMMNLAFGFSVMLATLEVDVPQTDISFIGFNMAKMIWFFIGMGGQLIARKTYKKIIREQ